MTRRSAVDSFHGRHVSFRACGNSRKGGICHMKKKQYRQRTLADSRKRQGAYLAMVLPGVLCLLAFAYLPMPGIVLAFKKYQMTVPTETSFFKNVFLNSLVCSEWNGLNNFTYLLKDAPMLIRNTVGYNVLFMGMGSVCVSLLPRL